MHSRRRVLLIEDEPGLRNVLTEVLREAGFHVVATGCPIEALRVAMQEPFGAIISDYALPGMNGLELLRKLAAQKATLAARFLLVTGAAADEDCRNFSAALPDRVLFKPFANDAFVAAVHRVSGTAAALPQPADRDVA